MRTITAICFAAGLAWATAADAHWQNTRWGMTEAEVRAVWPEAHEGLDSSYYVLRIDRPFQVGGVTYKSARFVFDTKGQLREVRLEVEDYYANIRQRMASQLGAPVNEEESPVFLKDIIQKSALFRDVAKGNSVSIWAIVGGTGPAETFITYKAIETGF